MTATRKNLSFGQQIAIDRRGNPYIYGGNWNPYKRAVGTDCSGCIVDILDAAINGTAMAWTRHNLSTENWRPPNMGGAADPASGPFGTVMVNSPNDFPSDAAVKLAFHHGPGGGANSHTWCDIAGLKVETNGDDGTVLNDGKNLDDDVLDVHTVDSAQVYGANNWWYLPGPIVEDGTPVPIAPSSPGTEAPDTLFPDVSEFQAPVDDIYLSQTYSEIGQDWHYRWISIRSNDGNHVDNNFTKNYKWCVKQCDAGNLDGFIVYYYWRPDGSGLSNHMRLVNSAGGPHPKMVSMIDVESGGNGSANASAQLNSEYSTLAGWLGNPARIIGYANSGDLKNIWPSRPAGLKLIIAGYGSNPNLPDQIAHQYTDGNGYGGGLPEGVAPFGNCDMNSADGYTPSQLAIALGVAASTVVTPPVPPPPPPIVAAPLTNEQMQDVYNLSLLIFQQVGGLLTDMPLLPGSPTPMPREWPASLPQVLGLDKPAAAANPTSASKRHTNLRKAP